MNPAIGQRFGRLTVLEHVAHWEPCGKTHIKLICRCDCGEISKPARSKVLLGRAKSCGCVGREAMARYRESRRVA